MRKILMMSLSVVVLFILASCSDVGTSDTLEFDWLPSVKKPDEILLYDRFDQRFLTYDTKTYSIVEKNDTPNYFQFEFKEPNANLYTTGHSIKNNYKIIQKNEGELEELLSMEPFEAIFPLALKDEHQAFFIKSYYDDKGNEMYDQRAIFKLEREQKKLKKLSNTEGLLTSSGVYYKDHLYFTTYMSEDDSYHLYKIDDSDLQNVPELVVENLASPEIYVSKNRLWLSNKNSIYCDEKTLPKGSLNYFYMEKLIQMNVNSTGDLVLHIIDVNREEEEVMIERVIDFTLDGDNMTVYTHDGIRSIQLN